MRALLDVNVLIALLDRDHEHHGVARRWLEDNMAHGWATCTTTQNGCLRIMSQPKYPNSLPVESVADLLTDMTATEHHEFWPDATSLLTPGVIDWRQVQGPRQITDLYLLALAARNEGRFVTFDKRIVKSAIPGAGDETLHVIPLPADASAEETAS